LTDNVTKLQIGHKGTVTFLRGSNRDDITNATIKRVKGNTVAMSFPQTTSTYKYQDVRRYLNETINRNIIFEIGEVPEPKRVRTRTSQIYRLLQSNVGILTKQIVVAQIAGFILILFTSIILGGEYGYHAFCGLFVLLATVVYFLSVYYYWPHRKFIDSPKLLQRYRNTFGLLVGLDIFIILSMIGLSGGIKGSHLVFILGLIPPIVGYVRGGGKTMICTSIGISVIIFFEMLGARYNQPGTMPSTWCSTLTQKVFHLVNMDLKTGDASQSIGFPIACGFGLLGGIFLSLIQSQLAISGAIPDQIVDKVHLLLRETIKDSKKLDTLIACVQQSYKKVGRIVNLTNIPELHSSEVHPLRDVVFQAHILALPGVKMNNRLAARRAAEMVFSAHWLDDMFDYLGYSALATDNGISTSIPSIEIDQISKFYHPYGINRIIRFIKGNSLWSYERSKWTEGIESGLLRIVLAGFIQSGNQKIYASSKERLKSEIKKFVTDTILLETLEKANTAFCWGISKTAMTLVLGMYWNQKKIQDLGNKCLVLDALFMPLLVWHNLREEIRREKLPWKGFDKNDKKNLQQEIEEAVHTCVNIINEKGKDIRSWNGIWSNMKDILFLVNQLYSPVMPLDQIYMDYRTSLSNLLSSK
jgi:hypothetical protein